MKSCAAVARLLDAHFLGPSQQRDRPTIVSHHGGSGLGDEINGWLISLVAALVSGRRFEVAPQATSYLFTGFSSRFDLNFTGGFELELIPRALLSFVAATGECGRQRDAPGCGEPSVPSDAGW